MRSAWISACGVPALRCQPAATMRPPCTMTAPTIGFGEVRPSALRASSSASRMNSSSCIFHHLKPSNSVFFDGPAHETRENKKPPEDLLPTALLHANHTYMPFLIPTIRSAPESHRIMPRKSRARGLYRRWGNAPRLKDKSLCPMIAQFRAPVYSSAQSLR